MTGGSVSENKESGRERHLMTPNFHITLHMNTHRDYTQKGEDVGLQSLLLMKYCHSSYFDKHNSILFLCLYCVVVGHVTHSDVCEWKW